MKKSVFTLLAIATMVVSMSSCSQNDGGSSNDLNLTQTSKDNGNSQSTQSTSQSDDNMSFAYEAMVTNDVLDFYDITITKTFNGQTTTYTLDKDAQIVDNADDNKTAYAAKTTGKDVFSITSSDNVRVTATVKVKADWKARLDAKNGADVALYFSEVKGRLQSGSMLRAASLGDTHESKDVDLDLLESFGKGMAYGLNFGK